MSKPVTIQWPVADTAAVSLLQTSGANVPLLINGTLATKDTTVATYALFKGIGRTVSLTSAGNLSGIQFTIKGLDILNNPVSQTIAGPNANTVYTTQQFSVVTSVTPNLVVGTNVSVGTGLTGTTEWYFSDYNRAVNALSILVSVNTAAITYTLESTFDDPRLVSNQIIFPPVDGVTTLTIPTNTPMLNATVGILANLTIPVYASRVAITASNATGSSTIYFLQQGTI